VLNCFEQFCINLTNEKLQQHFNQHVFKMEQEEYTKEEIDWSYIQFVDNQEILDLIEKKPGGIIALLDETCMLRNSTHEIFAEKLYQQFKGNPHFSRPKFARSDFTIHHYAGNVSSIFVLFTVLSFERIILYTIYNMFWLATGDTRCTNYEHVTATHVDTCGHIH